MLKQSWCHVLILKHYNFYSNHSFQGLYSIVLYMYCIADTSHRVNWLKICVIVDMVRFPVTRSLCSIFGSFQCECYVTFRDKAPLCFPTWQSFQDMSFSVDFFCLISDSMSHINCCWLYLSFTCLKRLTSMFLFTTTTQSS